MTEKELIGVASAFPNWLYEKDDGFYFILHLSGLNGYGFFVDEEPDDVPMKDALWSYLLDEIAAANGLTLYMEKRWPNGVHFVWRWLVSGTPSPSPAFPSDYATKAEALLSVFTH